MARPRSSNNFFSPRSKKTQRMHVVCLFLPASKIAPQLLRLRYIERAQRSVSKYVIRQPTKPFLSAKTTSPLAYTVVQRFSFCTTDAAHHVPCRLPQPKQNQKSTIQDPYNPSNPNTTSQVQKRLALPHIEPHFSCPQNKTPLLHNRASEYLHLCYLAKTT